jgi:small subunit ribosomal protein S20
MPSSKQAAKRLRQSEKRRIANKGRVSAMKTHIKRTEAAIASGDAAKSREELASAMQKIDKAAKHGTIHKNTASRRKSLLARKLNALK